MTWSYTAVEVIASLIVILGLIKLVIVLFSKKTWYSKVVVLIYKNPKIAGFVYAIFTAVVFYYLILELTLVQIMAVMGFASLMFGMALLLYAKDILPAITKGVNKPLSFWRIVYILIWVLLFVLTGKELLGAL
ncbi:hypothetical protein FJZ18_04465 [Candidatus Pacearchaeota archaeon]|nr:hypothetical protein [Candidatus Pacearchaeota archaeon]